ncbi:hypothetical protein OHS33_36235 [Streptomyces sp. NBC_00536]|uniref:hypothetical protein n=1 Tax=Streptomyces sp. NBC_00536 TaxID=2975769 RepID=UPI002E811741|nr:hypothetical protein [Streptomyces sp. NBC_00536]WUC83349.1 hypothetical protein OHS33_36235 [Streptomyces sp. NBC_00536]
MEWGKKGPSVANLVYKRVSTARQSTARQNLALDEAGIEDPVVFEEDPVTSSRQCRRRHDVRGAAGWRRTRRPDTGLRELLVGRLVRTFHATRLLDHEWTPSRRTGYDA